MTWQPTQAQIDRVLDKTKRDPEKLAIAYLRAQKRARDAEVAFGVMGDIQDLTMSSFAGDMKGAEKAVDATRRRMAMHNQVSEKWQ